MTRNIQYNSVKALAFLDSHPAYICGYSESFLQTQNICMYAVCKNGIDENSKRCTCVNRGEKGWEKFQKRFEKDESYIYVNYKEKFGYPWKFDSVRYFYEADFFAFVGDPYSFKSYTDLKNYNRYHGFTGNDKSFEQAIISCKKRTVKLFGNFCHDDMMTEEEKINHKTEQCFFFNEIKSGKNRGYSRLVNNPKWIDVSYGLMNLRWLKWFSQTPYCRDNWGKEFDNLVKNVDNVSG